MSDRQAIETISGHITNSRIDSISMSEKSIAVVYYKFDSINAYFSRGSYLYVFNVHSLDTSSPLSSQTPVYCGNWVSDSSCLYKFLNVDLHSDLIPFSATIHDSISIDSLRMFLRYLKDSTLCTVSHCYRVPLDSVDALAWYYKQDTVIIEMSQTQGHYYGLSYTFKWFGDTLQLSDCSRWME
jgi:hypothetical protein